MRLTDVQPIERWQELERELADRSGLTSVVFDADNVRVTDTQTWANELCPLIKGKPESASQVCAIAQMSMLAMARHTGETVIEECDAGMVKIVAPIVVGDELVGSVSACGRLLEEGELEHAYVAEVTGQEQGEVERLSSSVRPVTQAEAETIAAWMTERIGSLTH